MNYSKEFFIKPGKSFRLKDIEPAYTNGLKSNHQITDETQKHIARINQLQFLLYADNAQSLLIVLQALDGGGKDGVIRHLFSGMNPQGTSVYCFKQPTPEEASHDFLWRAHKKTPAKGQIVIFNRSHYEDVLVTRVHKLVKKSTWENRFKLIQDFEHNLISQGTKILKFYLHISPEEQLLRFKKRINDPARHWKISYSDYTEREYWPEYIKAYEDALRLTSTQEAPWFVIPSDHKWFRNLVISKIVADTLEGMKLQLPPTRVDLKKVIKEFHHAEANPH